jgi:hypothetical protein
MSVTILDSDSSTDGIGPSFRRFRSGPEQDLIEWFLAELPIRVPAGCRATVFREPRLESGFPDLVAVVWNVRVTREWNSARAEINRGDLRLVHYIHQRGHCRLTELHPVFGRSVNRSIARLEDAEMIRRMSDGWVVRALAHSFAARRIVAIEAKVNEWSVALEQASLNTWFASESYVLVPHIPRGDRLLIAAKSLGIGVWAKSAKSTLAGPTFCENLPRSYASWLFNEWAWRAVRHYDEAGA